MARTMTVSEVRENYPRPEGAAVQKRWRKLDRFMRAFIKRSPFLCLGTANAAGKADVSPRGDPPGFVQILDDVTLLIPDRPGNNHLDSIENIIANPNVGITVLAATLASFSGLAPLATCSAGAAVFRNFFPCGEGVVTAPCCSGLPRNPLVCFRVAEITYRGDLVSDLRA